MESIDDDAEALDIFMVKLDSTEHAKHYGLYSLPAVVHFEDGIPNVYDEDMTKEAVMAWLTDQKTGSFIEKVTPALLQVRKISFDLNEKHLFTQERVRGWKDHLGPPKAIFQKNL